MNMGGGRGEQYIRSKQRRHRQLHFQQRDSKLMIRPTVEDKAEYFALIPETKQRQCFRNTNVKPLKASVEQTIGSNNACY